MYRLSDPNLNLEFSFLHLNSIGPDSIPSPITITDNSHYIDDHSFINRLDTLQLSSKLNLSSLNLGNQELPNKLPLIDKNRKLNLAAELTDLFNHINITDHSNDLTNHLNSLKLDFN